MKGKKTCVDPIPHEFDSYEEAAEFWDTHDTTDYLNAFRTVEVEAEFRGRHYEVELDEDVVQMLQKRARELDVSVGYLASDLLRKQIAAVT